ncbi:alpha/beta hydrolase-fold protein [Lutimonas halocynthiae]|uniref:alpha/beta hydrolase-fold protein n=1 Tax=Lutimonas halocynthiae TaxID=1446477 RepID=UPI0025B56F32|nr:alpha/beta hydrolase-fold protein [Lutimonas halocynthiae]MDN3642496.1 alpha/beta hydrolase-fold protein [Lutimonas halocynthiae]
MNKFAALMIILLFVNCIDKKSEKDSPNASNEISFGKIDSLYSDVLGESRKIWVHIPAGADNSTFSTKKYPVLYLLDGPGHFYSVAGMIKQLSTTNGNTIVPQMIIVAIPNTNRTRDLTPTHTDESPFGDDVAWLKDSGGGETFTDFIEKELIPFIDEKYPTSPYRTYVGHSFGGLTVINTLISRPELFNNYVAIDPSLWWNNQGTLNEAKKTIAEADFENKSLFVGVANTLPPDMDLVQAKKDTTKETFHYRSILNFVESAEEHKENGLTLSWKYYPEDDHGSVPLISEYDALRSIFSWYRFDKMADFYDPQYNPEPEEMITIIEEHYSTLTDKFGYEVLPDEVLVNSLGYGFMSDGKLKLSEAAFDLNIKNYPKSFNVYDSKGDYYLAVKDSIKALELFEKAIEISPNEFSQEKADMLKSKK